MLPKEFFISFTQRAFPWNMWYFFADLPKNIKWFCQRGWRGYADCDLWNIDHYFLSTMIPMLKNFRNKNISYPPFMSMEEWHTVLDKIIKGFEAGRQIQEFYDFKDYDSYTKKVNALARQFKQSMSLFSKYFWHFWD